MSYGIALLSGGLFLVGLLASAEFVADTVLATDELAGVLRIAGSVLLAVTVNSVQTGISWALRRIEQWRPPARWWNR